MLCFKRKFPAYILFYCTLSYPLNLHADWSWSFPFNSAEQTQHTASASRGKTDVARPTDSQPVKPSKTSAPVQPVKSLQSTSVLPPLPETSLPVTGPKQFSPASPRGVAPFTPVFKSVATVIKEDHVWSGAVQVEGMVTVAAEATLTISPGTVIRFGANSGILVLGKIAAKGSAENPVILTSLYAEPLPLDWYGIVLTGTGKKNIFENVMIHGAETAIYVRFSSIEMKTVRLASSSTAISMLDSTGSFKDVAITDCPTGLAAQKSEVDLESVALEKGKIGIAALSSVLTADKLRISAFTQAAFTADRSHLKLDHGRFSANLIGARIIASDGSIINSRFIGNIESGVTLSGSTMRFSANLVAGNRVGLQLEDNLAAVWGNSIQGNMNYNLLYLGDEKIYLGGNWLGKLKPDSMDKSIFSRRPGAAQLLPVLASDPLSASETDL